MRTCAVSASRCSRRPEPITQQDGRFRNSSSAHDSSASSGKDLNGKTIATPALDSLSTLVISNWVDKHGGDSRTLKFVEIPISAAQAALELHRVDAALMNDTALATALASGNVRILAPAMDAVAPEFPYSGWFASSDWAAKHPDLVQALRAS